MVACEVAIFGWRLMFPRIALLNVGRPCLWLKAPNYGLLFIAANLQRELGINPAEILYVDQAAGDDVLASLERQPWDILGISSLSVTAHELNRWAPEIRKRWPDRCVVLGGVHVSSVPEIALRQSGIVYGVRGDGERSFARIVAGLRDSGVVPRDTPGLVWLENDALGGSGCPAQPMEDLDGLPPLPLDMMNRSHYFSDYVPIQGADVPALPWVTSRGCQYRCRFCAANVACGQQVRYQSAERVLDDLERLVRDYGVPAVSFLDDNFVANRPRLTAICEGILQRPRLRALPWACQARADCVDVNLLRLMKKAGCVQVAFGLESGSQRMLTYLKKGAITVEDGRRAVAACKEVGVRSMATFMIGSPTETRDDVLETFAFIHDNPSDFTFVFITTLLPGSEFWDLAVERGIIAPDTLDWRTLIFDQRPLLADAVDPRWLYRRYWLEYVRIALRNYSFPVFVGRAVRAAAHSLLHIG